MAGIGPVQLLTVAFGPEAKFEGWIVDELAELERTGQIRVLDLLFVQKESDNTLVIAEHQAQDMGQTVAALLGISRDTLRAAEETFPSLSEGNAFGLTLHEIRDLARALDPGTAAGFVLLEHTWAKELRRAVREAGGVPVAEGFLTQEVLESVVAEIAASVRRLEEGAVRDSREERKPGRKSGRF
ncbi:DUF1269 domain-containing family protein [Streptomyces sp. TLI_146]|uniref:DUF1269 domain-containing family protein n=1 Tax=Streptomyces sp. TLI_146 TaxID=1938858 RepID=UPI000C707D5E|nr:DUF1269 domain-containing family protein [Streptomyces sp. TLI_146]PKV90109.1 hypothetical protein BX283_7778 [Streptomyces sp. TLI_146]